ncbi:MAG: zinc transporter permease [Mycobacterium sp.]
MTAHPTHSDHDHPHGPSCGHVAVEHDGHVHHRHGDHYDEH